MSIHTCSYSCERPACIKAQRDELVRKLPKLVAEAVAAEREACAKVCEETRFPDSYTAIRCATAIRARGNHES